MIAPVSIFALVLCALVNLVLLREIAWLRAEVRVSQERVRAANTAAWEAEKARKLAEQQAAGLRAAYAILPTDQELAAGKW